MISGDLPAPRVLVVDDDELVTSVLHTALVRSGYSVRDAPNAATALHMLDIHPVDLVVLDAHMQGSTIEENLAAINALPDRPAVLVLSGARVDAALLERFGARFLAKPLEAAEFLGTVAAALEAR